MTFARRRRWRVVRTRRNIGRERVKRQRAAEAANKKLRAAAEAEKR